MRVKLEKLEHKYRVLEENEKSALTQVAGLKHHLAEEEEVNSRLRAEVADAGRTAAHDRDVANTRARENDALHKRLRGFESGVAQKVHATEKQNRALIQDEKMRKGRISELEKEVSKQIDALGDANIDMLAQEAAAQKKWEGTNDQLNISLAEHSKTKLQLASVKKEFATTKVHYNKAVVLSNKLMKEVKEEKVKNRSLEVKRQEAESLGKKEGKMESDETHAKVIEDERTKNRSKTAMLDKKMESLNQIVDNKTKQNDLLAKKLRQSTQTIIDLKASGPVTTKPAEAEKPGSKCSNEVCASRLKDAKQSAEAAQKAIKDFLDDKISEDNKKKEAEKHQLAKLSKATAENQKLKNEMATKTAEWTVQDKNQVEANQLEITALQSQLDLEKLKNSTNEEEPKKTGAKLSKRARRNAERTSKETNQESKGSQGKSESVASGEGLSPTKMVEGTGDELSSTSTGAVSLSDMSFNLSSDLSMNTSADSVKEPPLKKQRREAGSDGGKPLAENSPKK